MKERQPNRSGSVRRHCGAMSLTELMCVLAILSILAALYLPSVARAFVRIKHFLGGM
jgi:prepilin-type N-terminal cleavage/methylation domain-containing protein